MLREFPTAEEFLGQIVRIQMPTVTDPDATAEEKLLDAIPKQNETAEYIAHIWNKKGDKLGRAEVIDFPPNAPAYANTTPPRKNVLITIPSQHPDADVLRAQGLWRTRLIVGHFDNARPNLARFKRHNRDPMEILHYPGKPHRRYIWSGYDMNGANYGGLAGSLMVDPKKMGADTEIWVTCDEEAISAGAHALIRSFSNRKIRPTLDGILSGEILVNGRKRQAGKIPLILGRPGRFGFTVTVNGREMHAGEVEKQDKPYLTRTLMKIADKVVDDLQENLKTVSRGTIDLVPKCEPSKWHTHDEDSLTLPGSAWAYVNVHYANFEDTPDNTINLFRQLFDKELRNLLPSEDDTPFRDQALTVNIEDRGLPTYGRTPFTEPYIEDPTNPFFATVRTQMMHAYKECLDHIEDKDGFVFDGIQDLIDTGVADEPIYANEFETPIANIPLVGGRPHTYQEWVDLRSITYFSHLTKFFMEHPEHMVLHKG